MNLFSVLVLTLHFYQIQAHVSVVVNNIEDGNDNDCSGPFNILFGNCNQGVHNGVDGGRLPLCPRTCCRQYCQDATCSICNTSPCSMPQLCRGRFNSWNQLQFPPSMCFALDDPRCGPNSCTPRTDCPVTCGSVVTVGGDFDFCPLLPRVDNIMGMNMMTGGD